MHNPSRGAKPRSISDLIARFLDSEEVSPASKAVYTRQLRPFFRFALEDRREGGPAWDRGTIERYRAHLQVLGRAPSTISAYMTLVRKFFAWAAQKGHYSDIAKGIKGEKVPGGIRHATLTVAQVRAVLRKELWAADLRARRDFAAVNLMARAALSPAELARADVGDIRAKSGKRVLVLDPKDPGAFVVLRREIWSPLRAYLAQRHALTKPKAPLLASLSDRNHGERLTTRSVSDIAKAAFVQAGLTAPHLSGLTLRQTAIRMAIDAGASVQEAQALARHASPATTRDYHYDAAGMAEEAATRLRRALGAA
jgi:site-specific recombinase XerD